MKQVFQCPECPRTFETHPGLKHHLTRKHGAAKFSIKTRREQKIAERNLQPEKYPYACHVCDFRSHSITGVKAHMRSKHPGEIYYKSVRQRRADYDKETLEWLEKKSDENMLQFYSSRRKLTAREHRTLKRIRVSIELREEKIQLKKTERMIK